MERVLNAFCSQTTMSPLSKESGLMAICAFCAVFFLLLLTR